MNALMKFAAGRDEIVISFSSDELGLQPMVLAVVADMFEAAQATGAIPGDRAPLDNDSAVMVAMNNRSGAIVGAAVFFDAGQGRIWLDFLYVDPGYRQAGIGSALLRAVAGLGGAGVKKLIFGTLMDNHLMRRLAEREGFREEAITYGAALAETGGVVR